VIPAVVGLRLRLIGLWLIGKQESVIVKIAVEGLNNEHNVFNFSSQAVEYFSVY